MCSFDGDPQDAVRELDAESATDNVTVGVLVSGTERVPEKKTDLELSSECDIVAEKVATGEADRLVSADFDDIFVADVESESDFVNEIETDCDNDNLIEADNCNVRLKDREPVIVGSSLKDGEVEGK